MRKSYYDHFYEFAFFVFLRFSSFAKVLGTLYFTLLIIRFCGILHLFKTLKKTPKNSLDGIVIQKP